MAGNNVVHFGGSGGATAEAAASEASRIYKLATSGSRQKRLSFYNDCMRQWVVGALASAVVVTSALSAASAQTPQPFPRPGSPQQPPPPAVPPSQPAPSAAQAAPPAPNTPTEATLGFPIYPTAQFIASYDAGRGQRYYVFGTTASYADMVVYYRTQLKERGNQVFEEPPTHMFEVGRFRDETMAFPPGVTIKDWTWGGTAGYPNPKPDPQPARFPTIIMIVPAPPAPAPNER
jgi:hypothetical protein